jgi:two-component system CheB/CheR fusion protein
MIYSVMTLRDESGNPTGYATVSRDVTDWKRAEDDLRAAKEAAEKASSAKDEFLAVLSHELRTPLTPVLLSVSLLQGNKQLPPDVREDLATIRQNVELEARLIDDLLDLTRVARGLLHLNPAPLDVHLLLRGTIALCFPDDAIDIVTTDLAATRHHVFADPARLQQVFWNLLNNARKFTPPTGRIIVRTADDESGHLRINVTDTGIGIAPQLLPRIFDAFVQGDADGKKRGGLGLGLAIAKAIVTAHEGEISAHSDGAGTGANFAVHLTPIPAPTPTKPTPSGVGAPRTTATDQRAQPLHILLVEDNQPTLDVLQRLLTALGHRVTPASTVEAALQLAAEADHDLIISDIGLPDGTGYDLMRSLRERHDLPGIALSGYGMEDDVQKSLSAGFTEHLTKPIDLQTLQRSLSRLTSTR